jgi:hypothetical protein
MKRIIRLTESDLTRIVRRVLMEQAPETEYNDDLINKYGDKTFSIKLSDIGLEIMKTDLGKMDWDKAKKECENLGDGWRLPTID